MFGSNAFDILWNFYYICAFKRELFDENVRLHAT